LYEVRVKGKKKSEYILTEQEMRRRMVSRGLEGTQLIVRSEPGDEQATGAAEQTIGEQKLRSLVKALADLERITTVLDRRGIKFSEFISDYYDGDGLPRFMIRRQGAKPEVYREAAEYEKRLDELGEHGGAEDGNGERDTGVSGEELHEVVRINQINQKLKGDFGLDLRDYLLKPEKADSGESLPTKFQLAHGEDRYEIASLAGICPGVRQIGGKGIELKRFKGLGEMNAEQLWDTTMNPETRMLLNVRLDDAGEADRLFSILMGDDVEKRRRFIQDHALEVQNLDV
jgi:DNA gyrase subunit B